MATLTRLWGGSGTVVTTRGVKLLFGSVVSVAVPATLDGLAIRTYVSA